ncbi:MAG: glycosyltransferase family 2 protein [Magnetococcales bacterium]|nr:glycosyltransferase family 2 protein [Magnetococcales bacterium]
MALRDTLTHLCAACAWWPFPVEILVADNGSTDDTWNVLQATQAQQHTVVMRMFRYQMAIDPLRCFIALCRVASGKYTTYLADDDRLFPERLSEIIRFMDQRSDIVAYYAPWQLQQHVDLPLDLLISQIDRFTNREFNRFAAIELFYSIIHYGMPEAAIFRANVLSDIAYLPDRWEYHFYILFRLLEEGTVYVDPVPFYGRDDGYPQTFGEFHKNGYAKVADNDSGYTALQFGVQFALATALKLLGSPYVPGDAQVGALERINQYYARVFRTVAYYHLNKIEPDYRAFFQFSRMSCTWQPCDTVFEIPVAELDQRYVMRAVLEAMIDRLADPEAGRLVFLKSEEPDMQHLLQQMRELRLSVKVDWLSEQEMLSIADNEYFYLIVTYRSDLKERLMDGGLPPGRIVLIPEWEAHWALQRT